ncbi:UBX domain-containing protein 4 [Anabrus simplex]|uniref:UBX domain-containing protein 4 n=1 Tax=Anabrus simplex TaxID=316456 RepID=UPI0035A2FFCA
MRWFEGSIAEAVAACKSRRAVFVVFVEGQDDSSRKTLATLEDSTISSQLESDDFIVIKLDSGSESYRQFAQIYQLVPVPSVFFIGANGTPLEVVAGEIAVADLAGRIKSVLAKCGKSSCDDTVIAPQQDEAVACTAQASEPSPSTSSASPSPSIAEKVERAKELIEKKRQQKQEEEERLERNRELERRRVGQEVQKLQRWQQEQEVKELREHRRKEKLEEQAARQRVLDQINQDRAERAARMTAGSGMAQSEQKEESRVPAQRSDVARIQFRLPDGSSHTQSFSADTPLAEVRAYAATNLALPFRDFAMSTTFPRREFTGSDNCRSVSELELVPTAVILILPASSSAVVSSPGYFDAVTRMIWSLLAPLAAILTYLRELVFRRGGNPGGSGSHPSSSATNTVPENTGTQTTRRRAAHSDSTSSIQRQGNIHRLTTRRDSSDDENNTWNGNSTQQM